MPADELDALMIAAQSGDAESYAQLIEQTQHVVRATMLRDTADADELAQEAFTRRRVYSRFQHGCLCNRRN